MANEKDYPVGYKKPPLHSQFKPGQSGNPKGRPKKTGPTLLEAVQKELAKIVLLAENGGQPRKVPKLEAVLARLVAEAMKGNIKATTLLLRILGQAQPESDANLLCLLDGFAQTYVQLEATTVAAGDTPEEHD